MANVVGATAFRAALVDFAGGFTEMRVERGTRYVIALGGRGAKQRMREFLAAWESHTREGKIEIEDQDTAPDGDEIYFLLPLQRNPDPVTGQRLPLFTNEQLDALGQELGERFHYRPEMVQVYGQWKNDSGVPIPDDSFLIRVPRRTRNTPRSLREFIRAAVLGARDCDQDCIYLSDRWRGYLVR